MGLDISFVKSVPSSVLELSIPRHLDEMAREAGVYWEIWHADRHDNAAAILPMLEKGLKNLKQSPDRFKKLNHPDGYVNYSLLVEFIEKMIKGCKDHPDARVNVWA